MCWKEQREPRGKADVADSRMTKCVLTVAAHPAAAAVERLDVACHYQFR